MTIVLKRALLLAPAVLVVSAATLADTTPAKCGGQNTAPLVAIDGVITALQGAGGQPAARVRIRVCVG